MAETERKSGRGSRIKSIGVSESSVNPKISRGDFVKTVGVGAAALGMSAMGMSGNSNAATLPPGGPNDPHGLLAGASTTVPSIKPFPAFSTAPPQPAPYIPARGILTSKVTAVKFHTNEVVGNNFDGSPQYKASNLPGGLVDNPVGMPKEVNGIKFVEYSGELSGYLLRNCLVYGMLPVETVYGPIDETGLDHNTLTPVQRTHPTLGVPLFYTVDPQSGETGMIKQIVFEDTSTTPGVWKNYPAGTVRATPPEIFGKVYNNPRYELKGVNFQLQIPENWNGVLLHEVNNMMFSDIDGVYDPIYLLSQGYALAIIQVNPWESSTDTNRNNDEFWKNGAYSMAYGYYAASFQSGINPPFQPGTAPFAYTTSWAYNGVYDAGVTIQRSTGLMSRPMFMRDSIAVMKNICKYHAGTEVEHTFYMGWSGGGSAAMFLKTGLSYDSGSTKTGVFDGGNSLVPYANCPVLPDGTSNPQPNPQYDPNAQMVYDGFILKSPGGFYGFNSNGVAYGRATMPFSKAPVMILSGETDILATRFNEFVLPRTSFITQNSNPMFSQYWPDTKQTFFSYSFEHDPHGAWTGFMALAYDNGGLYVDENGFNTDGSGNELNYHYARLYSTALHWQNPSNPSDPLKILLDGDAGIFGGTLPPRSGPVFHQMVTNMHQYVSNGVAPPKSNINPYWITNDYWPKFPNIGPDDRKDQAFLAPKFYLGLTPPSPPFFGLIRMAINAVTSYNLIDYEVEVLRLPEDQVRLGLYTAFQQGERISRPFTETQLIRGFSSTDPMKPLDWDGTDLVTLTLPNGIQIPQAGYKNHGGYVRAMSYAIQTLAERRLYDPFIGSIILADAAQTKFPLITSKNRGATKRGMPSLPEVDLEGFEGFKLE
ncbi:hypothetical protein L0Y65_02835 [Candidatus Micrarchaeota archaeon]|nr:hypothetical protein [Candidatus Micrarchaeota archaeon]